MNWYRLKKRRGLKSQGHQLRLTRNKVCTVPRKLHVQKGEQRPFKISKESSQGVKRKKMAARSEILCWALRQQHFWLFFYCSCFSNLLALESSVWKLIARLQPEVNVRLAAVPQIIEEQVLFYGFKSRSKLLVILL